MEVITPGDTRTIKVRFWDGVRSYVDPASPTVTIRNPSGTVVVANGAMTKKPDDELGEFSYDFTVPGGGPSGKWTVEPGSGAGWMAHEYDTGLAVMTSEAMASSGGGGDTRVTIVCKQTDQVVTNSNAPVVATDLVVPLLATTSYLVKFAIVYSGQTATGDFRWRFAFPAIALARQAQGFHSSLTAADASQLVNALGSTTQWPAADVIHGVDALNTVFGFHGQFVLRTGPTAGNLSFMFAQGTAVAATTATCRAGSRLEVVRLTP